MDTAIVKYSEQGTDPGDNDSYACHIYSCIRNPVSVLLRRRLGCEICLVSVVLLTFRFYVYTLYWGMEAMMALWAPLPSEKISK